MKLTFSYYSDTDERERNISHYQKRELGGGKRQIEQDGNERDHVMTR